MPDVNLEVGVPRIREMSVLQLWETAKIGGTDKKFASLH